MSIRKKFIVKKRDIADVTASIQELSTIDNHISDIDYFIGACGFEERILAIPNIFTESGKTIKKGILLGKYETNPSDNKEREEQLIPILQEINGSITYFDAESPEDTYKAIAAVLTTTDRSEEINLGFDISGCSATLIISTILGIVRTEANVNLTIFYTTANEYHEPVNTDRDEPVSLWKSSDLRETGVIDVSANELAPGIQHDHLPTYVIALPSMFPARLQRGLSFLGIGAVSGADENIYWILPTTDDLKHKWRQQQVRTSLLSMIHGTPEEVPHPSPLPEEQWGYCDVLDYKACLRLIMKQIEGHAGANISIIHAGTKIQAIGVALALAARREVALVKARPQSFAAKQYSTGIGQSFGIELKQLSEIIKALSAVGSLDIENN